MIAREAVGPGGQEIIGPKIAGILHVLQYIECNVCHRFLANLNRNGSESFVTWRNKRCFCLFRIKAETAGILSNMEKERKKAYWNLEEKESENKQK